MAAGFVVMLVGAIVVLFGSVYVGVILGGRFLRDRYPNLTKSQSRFAAATKQVLGWVVWWFSSSYRFPNIPAFNNLGYMTSTAFTLGALLTLVTFLILRVYSQGEAWPAKLYNSIWWVLRDAVFIFHSTWVASLST